MVGLRMNSGIEENIPSLRRYAWSLLRNKSDADDLVQDCLVRALDSMDSLRRDSDLRAWLFTIMHNIFASRWRRMRNRARLLAEHTETEAIIAAPQQASAEMRDVLRGLDTLPDEQREVILLVAVEGFHYDEVASMLGIPIGTVMSRLSRARDRLSQFVQGQERPMLRRVK
jgi:RNA polymerase sigma-70 factor (ECF subfamily)